MTDLAVAERTDKVEPLDPRLRAAKNSLQLEGHWRNHHQHKVGPGVTQDTVRHPDYWASVATKLHRHDIIYILANDETWELEACVERVLHGGAHISIRKLYKRQGIADGGTILGNGEFYSEWRPAGGWCVARRSDDVAVVQGFALEELAIADWQKRQPRKVA